MENPYQTPQADLGTEIIPMQPVSFFGLMTVQIIATVAYYILISTGNVTLSLLVSGLFTGVVSGAMIAFQGREKPATVIKLRVIVTVVLLVTLFEYFVKFADAVSHFVDIINLGMAVLPVVIARLLMVILPAWIFWWFMESSTAWFLRKINP